MVLKGFSENWALLGTVQKKGFRKTGHYWALSGQTVPSLDGNWALSKTLIRGRLVPSSAQFSLLLPTSARFLPFGDPTRVWKSYGKPGTTGHYWALSGRQR